MVSGLSVIEQLLRAIRGEVTVTLADPVYPWDFSGNCAFMIGDWKIVFFNDCGELDYCDHATAPDGQEGDFNDWYRAGAEPIDSLTEEEVVALERLLEDAK